MSHNQQLVPGPVAEKGPILKGEQVRLEPLSLDHVRELAPIALDPELWRFTVSQVRTEEDLGAYIAAALRERDAGTALPFLIRECPTGRAVGSTRFGNIDVRNRRVEIGWTWIGRAWQRTAVNTEAKLLLLKYAFETLGCNRVEFKTDVLNERSRAALARIGAREEGVMRRHMVTDSGRVRDSVYFSIIAEEWPEVRAKLEARLRAGAGSEPQITR
jgi:RimJ/RimL family protein N-acetyltransferase